MFELLEEILSKHITDLLVYEVLFIGVYIVVFMAIVERICSIVGNLFIFAKVKYTGWKHDKAIKKWEIERIYEIDEREADRR